MTPAENYTMTTKDVQEHIEFFEILATQQERISSDSCDTGIFITPENTGTIKEAMERKDELTSKCKHRSDEWRQSDKHGETTSIFIPNNPSEMNLGITLFIGTTHRENEGDDYLWIDFAEGEE